MMTKRLLQYAVAIGALVPFLAGAAGIVAGSDMTGDDLVSAVSLDSHFRYLSAILTGIGVGFWTTIPAIEKQTERFRLLSALVILGGLGRFYSLITTGVPNHGMLFGLVMELVIVPLLVFWQSKVAYKIDV